MLLQLTECYDMTSICLQREQCKSQLTRSTIAVYTFVKLLKGGKDHMQHFPWWSEAQKELAEDAKAFTDEVLIPLGERCAYKKQFPWQGVPEMAKKGWFGAQIPAKYGGRAEEWGVTGACIILEETTRAAEVAGPLSTTMIGGIHQILHDGTDKQKERWLPKIAAGELLGAITMTEPYAGSDIAGLESTATRDGDSYVVNGKKRFQTVAA